MASVEFQNVTKSFGTFNAVSDISFKVADGEFICLLGPSGCGKTTSLRMIAGLETPSSGKIMIGPDDVTHLHPKDRQISMVFQDYALYPHMNLADNIAYPLKVRGESVEKRHGRAKEVADVLKIGDLLQRLPSQISGGQQQRTSLARALVYPSRVYLFDEPLSNLDAKLRLEARGFLNHLQRDMGMTAVYVTHDQAEAMALATRIAVMDQGKIVQYASPIEIYRRPATTFVANFVGNPPMNMVPVEATVEGEVLQLRAHGLIVRDLPLSAGIREALGHSKTLTLGVRPEHLSLSESQGLPLAIDLVERLGGESYLYGASPGLPQITLKLDGQSGHQRGETVSLALPSAQLHLFDETGRAIRL